MDELFPYDSIRPIQKELMEDVAKTIEKKKNLIAHAPTGLGKTASTLSIAIKHAIKNDLTVFFLTNRHTQHRIAIETIQEIKKKHNVDCTTIDLVGKKWMCIQDGVKELYNQEFNEFCRAIREGENCEFFTKLYKKNSSTLSIIGQKAQNEALQRGAMHVQDMKAHAKAANVCPYYFSTELAKKAKVIIADYFNVFNPVVQQNFFARAGKDLEKSIIIVDEGHNLSDRMRRVLSSKLSTFIITNAIQEAKKYKYLHAIPWFQHIQDTISRFVKNVPERIVSREVFIDKIEELEKIERIISECEIMGNEIREAQKRSFIGSIAEFLEAWNDEEEGYVRYVEQRETRYGPSTTIHYACLDAALVTSRVYEKAYATITMSGTLLPTEMFRDTLGIPYSMEKEYGSPFPKENRRALIVPETTTKYSMRSEVMFEKIATICRDIAERVPGNVAFFFPSYTLMNDITMIIQKKGTTKPTLTEKSIMDTHEKNELINTFKSHKEKGAILFAVAAANFSEGIDLPGDFLKAVVVVGLPLAKPDIQTRALINYYDHQFGKGWDYGYVFPAMTKCLQAAGRCIRSETDKGLIVFLDQRFVSPQYYGSLPQDWDLTATRQYKEEISSFFGK